jgi:hypothetical protein
MPSIQASAQELDTLHIVIFRCRYIAIKLGQLHMVMTADEALY